MAERSTHAAARAEPGGNGAPDTLRVITFNTAVGNPRIRTPQRAFLELPFYREVIEGSAEAAILALQEVGPEQAEALKQAAGAGSFRVIHIQRPGQGNALLVPRRFEVLRQRSRYFVTSQLVAVGRSLWRWVRGGRRPDHRQLAEPRMWSEARLRDRRSGRTFSAFNTHLSGDPIARVEQARALFRRARAARRDGPVIVAGDLNTRMVDTEDPEQSRADATIRTFFGSLRDMGASAPDPGRPSIDFVLADGFEAVSARHYTGDSLQLPGLPSAEVISDHYAREHVLRFA